LWIWHSFFGLPGSHNNINVLNRSHLFSNLLNGITPTCHYTINGHQYNQGYFLAAGIYPDLSKVVKTISEPQGLDKKVGYFDLSLSCFYELIFVVNHFAKMQEAARKDVERAFGILQAQFAIIARPARGWTHHNLQMIMKCCVILHNMIIETKQGMNTEFTYNGSSLAVVTAPEPARSGDFSQFVSQFLLLHNSEKHYHIQNDLVSHLWALKGSEV
jgi:hypothetical protein